MFISRKHYDDLRAEWQKNHAEADVLGRQNTALLATIDWMCSRLTQAEHERSILTKHYMGITIETPEFRSAGVVASQRAAVDAREVPLDIPATLGVGGMFADMGNIAAKKAGLDWDDSGKIVSAADKK